jgi:hypothetical protein
MALETSPPVGENPAVETPPAEATALPISVIQAPDVVSVGSYTSVYGDLEIAGLVENRSPAPLDLTEILVELLDASGEVVYQDSTFMALDYLAPGEASPFFLSIYQPPEGWQSFRTTVVDFNPMEAFERATVQVSATRLLVDEDGDLHLVGQLTNPSAQPVLINSLAGATFGAEREILTAGPAAVLENYLAPGQTGVFRVLMNGPQGGQPAIADHQVYVDSEYSDPLAQPAIDSKITHQYTDGFGGLHLVGEVVNGGLETLTISLIAAAYTADGNLLDAATFDLPQDALASGQRAPFDISEWGALNFTAGLADQVTRFELRPNPYLTLPSGAQTSPLPTSGEAAEYESGSVTLSGQAINDTGGPLIGVVVVVTVRDNSGQVLATGSDSSYERLESGAGYDYAIFVPLWQGFDPNAVQVSVAATGLLP